MALDATEDTKPTHVAGERLKSIVARIERLEEKRKALGSDIKHIYSEAKSAALLFPLRLYSINEFNVLPGIHVPDAFRLSGGRTREGA